MTEGLLLAGAVSLLAVGAANLAVAVLALRSARRYVELSEARMERLRKDHARILRFLRQERRVLYEMISEKAEQETEEPDYELAAKRDAGRRIERLKRELLAPAAAARRHRVMDREGPMLAPEDPSGGARGLPERGVSQKREARGKKPPPAGFPQTRRESAGGPPEEKGARRAVWHPHPDDDVRPGGAPAGRTRASAGASDGASVEIFRRHYDKYLENYEGYVKLAGRIYRMRDGASPGSPAEREWEERLRRVNDGIERTTARLDILEEYNPELATDDRISRRARIARAQFELGRL